MSSEIYTCIFAFLFFCLNLVLCSNVCTTPQNTKGQCILLNDCLPLIDLINKKTVMDKEVAQRLKQSHCGFVGLTPKVCCESSDCVTPSNQAGKCIPYDDCRPLESYLNSQRKIDNNDYGYLSKFECRYGNSNPKICCPFDPIVGPNTTETVDSSEVPEEKPDSGPFRSNHFPAEYICGVQNSDKKLLGGMEAQIGEFPWLALLEYHNGGTVTLGCGGSLISNMYVLTAAHCTVPRHTKKYGAITTVRLGEHDVTTDPDCISLGISEKDCNEKIVRIDVGKVIPHEDFSESDVNKAHDVALIKLKALVAYTDFIKPICLPNSDSFKNISELNSNMVIIVAGWGQTENDTKSDVKLKLTVPIFNKERCQTIYQDKLLFRSPIQLGPKQFCAGGQKGKDSCKGDSGGPMMMLKIISSDVMWYQIGIVSFGPNPCGKENVPAVYTNVAEYMSWINSKIEV